MQMNIIKREFLPGVIHNVLSVHIYYPKSFVFKIGFNFYQEYPFSGKLNGIGMELNFVIPFFSICISGHFRFPEKFRLKNVRKNSHQIETLNP